MTENKCPPYKNTECRSCGTKKVSLFARGKMRDIKDFFCKACMEKGKHTEEI